MDSPYQGSADVHVLPTNLTLPGVGVLPINAYLIMAEEPVLIDSGIGDRRRPVHGRGQLDHRSARPQVGLADPR